jgi:hypothetical protein
MPALPLMLMQAVGLEPTLLFGARCPEPLPMSALITVQCTFNDALNVADGSTADMNGNCGSL